MGVNRQFLLNTVHGLNSHNRREEEEDCWRQHRLERESRCPGLPKGGSQSRHGGSADKESTSAAHPSTVDARRYWAEEKQRAMTAAAEAPFQPTTALTTGLNPPQSRKRACTEFGESGGSQRKKEKPKRARHSESVEGDDTVEESQLKRENGGDREERKTRKFSKKPKKSKKSRKRTRD